MAHQESASDREELTYPSNPWNVVRAFEGALRDAHNRDNHVITSIIENTVKEFSAVAYQFISAAVRLRQCIK